MASLQMPLVPSLSGGPHLIEEQYAMSPPLHELSAAEAARRIAAGEVTSEALVRACLERIEVREPNVAAWSWLDPGRAIEVARARDRAGTQGPLHGVPIGVKDIVDTCEMPTAYGSPIYSDHRPVADAACIARSRIAGAIVRRILWICR
jgi:Asp-tRNA(Asn)/Glu-tRNA(Gln) amidotransferase A subunit family amidase